jgi:hypothetical protein
MAKKTLEEIEKLKRDWKDDPCWDIEDTVGFEEHKEELLDFRLKVEAERAEARTKKRALLASKFCPMSFSCPQDTDVMKCEVEQCAWWDEPEEMCVIRALVLK